MADAHDPGSPHAIPDDPSVAAGRNNSMLYAARRALSVDTSAWGEFEPSLVRKTGSVPPVASKRAWTPCGVIVHPVAGWWQLTQARPFVPRLWKNGPVRSTVPVVLKVAATPLGLANGSMLGRNGCPPALPGALTMNDAANAAHTRRC